MNRDPDETEELGAEDWELEARRKVSRIFRMEIPAVGLDSEASFERLMRTLDDRRDRQRRRRLLLARSLGVAAIIIGLMATLRLLHR